ncbi:MAG TPA: F0F1 ATP synthase subunit delta [Povalibacter sp.]|nr:F0F1 ATP synthase subunit delta [Povalibacter sp.]
MAEKVTIARPYARAAFEYASTHKAFGRWSELFATASAVVADERVERLLTNPRVTPEQLVGLIADIAGAGVDEHGRNFLNMLAQNRRLGLLPEIAAIFEVLRAEVENIADVQITSAIALSDAQRERLTAALKKRLRREVRLHCDVDASLIGGAIVRSGDLVIDGSLKAGLERLAGEIAR